MSAPLRDTLSLITDLKRVLTPSASSRDAKRWWTLVQLIESSLDLDARYSKTERQLVSQLKSGMSEVIAARRDGLNPVYSLAFAPLYALENSIMRRTTGTDGYPLR